MKISPNTTAIDVAFNLSGSLTAFPSILNQLPIGKHVGFPNKPKMWEDVTDVGQTWTPNIDGNEYDITVPLFNTLGAAKAPYTTNLAHLAKAWTYGNDKLREILTELEPF